LENEDMDTVNTPPGIEADLQEVLECVSSGKTVDHDLKRRVRERAENIRQQILATHGIQNIGVDLIRELRGELPDA
jgi:hypothetical protein